MNNEPVLLSGLARILAAAAVAGAGHFGLKLDASALLPAIIAAEMAISLFIRSKVSPVKP